MFVCAVCTLSTHSLTQSTSFCNLAIDLSKSGPERLKLGSVHVKYIVAGVGATFQIAVMQKKTDFL